MDDNFLERQKELCLLSSFISEHEEWLRNWLNALGWTEESLQSQGSPELLQCPFNPNHYVPASCVEVHKKKCQLAVHLGTNIISLEEEELTSLTTDASSFLYKDTSAECIQIGDSVENAVKKLAVDFPEVKHVSRSHDHQVIDEHFSSLETAQPSPEDIHSKAIPQLISFIKAWKIIPCDFAPVSNSSLDMGRIKGWLFKNLPAKHAYSTALGGEITMVDSMMTSFTPPSNFSRGKTISLTPNILMNKLRPLLGISTRSLVLDLWKFIHISRLQKECGMSDSHLKEIAPMPSSVLEGMKMADPEKEDTLPSISDLIIDIMKQSETNTSKVSLPLPPDHVTHRFSVSERRILYDYIVEVASRQAFVKLDPNLYRDDMAVLNAKLRAQSKQDAEAVTPTEGGEQGVLDTKGKTYLQLLKEKRDYKRRRQKYRAKNVHITRRTPTEIFRTIINNRMEELKASLVESDIEGDAAGNQPDNLSINGESTDKISANLEVEKERRQSRDHEKRSERRRRSRERDDRRDHRKRHRRSRSRRRSRERGRRSRSREKHRHKKRRKRSRSRS